MNHPNRFYNRRGLTLVELMVASTLGLMLVIGVVEAFKRITSAVSKGRASVELSGKLRTATNLMRDDFAGITANGDPIASGPTATGYFEIIEGVDNDLNNLQIILTNNVDDDGDGTTDEFDEIQVVETLSGDTDDILMFTSRRLSRPFSGKIASSLINRPGNYSIIHSQSAEVIYWLEYRNTENLTNNVDDDGDGTFDELDEIVQDTLTHNNMPLPSLRRRALLIRPDLNLNNGYIRALNPNGPFIDLRKFLNENDISIRVEDGKIIANSLEDLAIRRNRVAHVGGFPNPISPAHFPFKYGEHAGEDILIDQVIGFDVQVFDPIAKVYQSPTGDAALVPTDPGYKLEFNKLFDGNPTNDPIVVGSGAYVDLGFAHRYENWTADSLKQTMAKQLGAFSWIPHSKSRLHNPYMTPTNPMYFQYGRYFTYDSWTGSYERDGLDQDGDGDIDEGFNGVDDPTDLNRDGDNEIPPDGIVDNIEERETAPPYVGPLYGFQVIVRGFQNSQQQMRQFTVSHDFTRE